MVSVRSEARRATILLASSSVTRSIICSPCGEEGCLGRGVRVRCLSDGLFASAEYSPCVLACAVIVKFLNLMKGCVHVIAVSASTCT